MKPPSLFTWPIFPVTVAAFALVNARLLEHGASPRLVSGATFTGAILALLLLERLLPLHRAWNSRPSGADVALLFGNRLVDVGGLVLGTSLATRLASIWPAGWLTHLWPTSWPLLAQGALGLVVGEPGRYALHRISHRPGFLWRVHSMHHSPERMYALNGPRLHPIDQALKVLAGPLVMMVLGARLEAVVLATSLFALLVVFQHSNTNLRYDGLNRIFVTADLHRWHHVRGRDARPANFALAISLVDAICGTFRLPERPPAEGEIGIAIDEPEPALIAAAREARP